MKSQRILIIIAYFGKLPHYFEYFCKSVFANEGILDVLLVTDQEVQRRNNLYVHNATLKNLRERLVKFIQKNSDAPFNQRPIFRATDRKICDIKVVFRFLFDREIKNISAYDKNDYVGYGDLDVVYGNLASYMAGEHRNIPALTDFEVIGLGGHFTAIKFGSVIWENMLSCHWLYESLVRRTMTVLDEGNFRKYLVTMAGVHDDKDEKFLSDYSIKRKNSRWHQGEFLDNFYTNKIPLIGLAYKSMHISTKNKGSGLGFYTTQTKEIESFKNIDKLVLDKTGLHYHINDKKNSIMYCHLGSKLDYDFIGTDDEVIILSGKKK
tara:strand:+ start:40529 stop:41494 length:966 start_codon:yes stop_codon:yes gene_type:complete